MFQKKKLIVSLALLLYGFVGQAQNFITKWTLPAGTTTSTNILRFSIANVGNVNYTWYRTGTPGSGSGTLTTTSTGLTIRTINVVLNPGDTLTLEMTPANLRRFSGNSNGADNSKLIDVSQWGAAPWTSMNQAFYLCSNLNITATDLPNLSGVHDMGLMFGGCSKLNGPANINNWNVSAVTDMLRVFEEANIFNQDISDWNTSNVTRMTYMFRNAFAFNQDISGWNTSNVTDMSYMFRAATAFNQNIGGWNTGKVTNMRAMLSGATAFDQNLGNWNISSVNNNTGESMLNMLNDNGMSCVNYSKTLVGWANDSSGATAPNNVVLGASGRVYSPEPQVQAARETKLPAKGWVINEDTASASSCNISLPVIFGNVAAKIQNDSLIVTWSTVAETACDYFAIEVSADGQTFQEVSTISSKASNGNSDISIQYEQSLPLSGMAVMGASLFLLSMGMMLRRNKWLGMLLIVVGMSSLLYGCSRTSDELHVNRGTVYVRVKQVDKDGKSSYSETVKAVQR